MKTNPKRRGAGGYVAYVTVIATGAILTMLMVVAYKRALRAQSVQSDLQLRMDYSEKEDEVLRSIVAIVPNRAMRAMQNGSAAAGTARNTLRWQNIFADAVKQANAGTSLTAAMKTKFGQTSSISANTGDGGLATTNLIFTNAHGAGNTVYVTPGINRAQSPGYPESLIATDNTVKTNDLVYPIISTNKSYNGAGYKILKYPQINFGYAKPGENFLAKRNWWAFSMDLADHDDALTSAALSRREFVLSIYEVPSQLAISASSYVNFGKSKEGTNWRNVQIEGNVFADNAVLDGTVSLPGLATRRGMTLKSGTTVAGQNFGSDPFAPGIREQYEVDNGGFFPISMPSESGRAAFIPINRGIDFFDRHTDNNVTESNTLSGATTWTEYSSGALQCAMRLDVVEVTNTSPPEPLQFRFEYFKGGMRVKSPLLPVVPDSSTPLRPFEAKKGPLGRMCVYVYPERFYSYLISLGADDLTVNNSLVVNSDYRSNVRVPKPSYSAGGTAILPGDYGLVMEECANLERFTTGFSLVTNYRLYIGDDFNTKSITPRVGYTGPSPYYPPCSLFAPEKRFGTDAAFSTLSVEVSGQIGSLASKDAAEPARPLDSRGYNDQLMNSDDTALNLRPMVDPDDLPPIRMMNWLIVLEERRKEFW